MVQIKSLSDTVYHLLTTGITFFETRNSKQINYCVPFWRDELPKQGTFSFTRLKEHAVPMK
jgi:hypothetical protein